MPLLNQYVNDGGLSADYNEMHIDVPFPPNKRYACTCLKVTKFNDYRRRESNPILQELVHLVGKSVSLYNMMLHFFRTLFVSTNNTAFCTLRADLLMALHDAGVSEVWTFANPKFIIFGRFMI